MADSSHLDLRSVPKLDGDNYVTWKFQVQLLLESVGAKGVVTGALVKNEASSTESAAYDKLDLKARTIISGTVGPNQIPVIFHCTGAKAMWDALAATHDDKSQFSMTRLYQQFYSYTYDASKSLTEMYHEIERIAIQLRENGRTIEEELVVSKITSCLPASCKPLKASWDSVPVREQTMANLLQRLKKEDQEIKAETEDNSANVNAEAFMTKTGNKGKGNSSKKNPNHGLTCHYCKKRNHVVKDCRKKMADEKSGSGESTPKVNPGNVNSQSGNNGKQTGSKKNGNPSAYTVADGAEFLDTWIHDSGCSQHLTCQREWFIEFKDHKQPVHIADRSKVYSVGIGTVQLEALVQGEWKTIHLKNVLYVPQMLNLFSEAMVVKRGFTVVSNMRGATFYNEDGEEDISSFLIDGKFIMNFRPLRAEAMATMSQKDHSMMWHARLGHVNIDAIVNSSKVIDGIENVTRAKFFCEDCNVNKMTRLPYPSRDPSERNFKPGECAWMDIAGKFPTPSLGGSQYFLLIKDDATGFRKVNFLKVKSEAASCVENYIEWIERQTGNKVKFLRSDCGGEFSGKAFKSFLAKKGITLQQTVPHCPQSRGRIEREIRTIKDQARCNLNSIPGVPRKLWAEAVAAAVYIRNRLCDTQSSSMTSYEAIFGKRPQLGHVRMFGCDCYAHLPTATGWDPRAKKVMLCGYDPSSTNYRVYDQKTDKIQIVRNVRFNEPIRLESSIIKSTCDQSTETEVTVKEEPDDNVADDNSDGQNDEVNNDEVNNSDVTLDNVDEEEPLIDTSFEDAEDTQTIQIVDASEHCRDLTNLINTHTELSRGGQSSSGQSSVQAEVNPSPVNVENVNSRTESTRVLRTNPKQVAPYQHPHCTDANVVYIEPSILVPKTYSQAIMSEDALQWHDSMEEEFNNLMKHNVFTLIPKSQVPHDRKVLKGRWVYRLKHNEDGSIKRFKSRYVLKGYEQVPGRDFNDTWAPVCRHESVRILFSLAVSRNLQIGQFDIVGAFLNGELDEELYMTQVEGFESQKHPDHVAKLNRALYGIKQGPACWNKTFTQHLRSLGFHQSQHDPCVFIGGGAYREHLYLCIYVDDALIFSSSTERIKQIMAQVEQRFEMKIEPATNFIGFSIFRDVDYGEVNNDKVNSGKVISITLSQHSYVRDVLQQFNMEDAISTNVPFQPGIDFYSDEEITNFPYRQAIGSLLYLSCLTRPDIAFHVSFLSRFLDKPKKVHVNAVKYILRYLKSTANLGIQFTHQNDRDLITGYSDADWATDNLDRKSVSGYVFMCNGGPISWRSQRQPIVSLSSTESEYIALSCAAQEAIWLGSFLEEFSIETRPIPIMVDNSSSIKLAENPMFHKRSKHIDLRFHFTRELVKKKVISVEKISTKEQLADPLTKPLQRQDLERHRKNLGLVPANLSSRVKPGLTFAACVKMGKPIMSLMTIFCLVSLISVNSAMVTDNTTLDTDASFQQVNFTNVNLTLVNESDFNVPGFDFAPPVLWHVSPDPIVTGYYDIYLDIEVISPCVTLDALPKDEGFASVALRRHAMKVCNKNFDRLMERELEQFCPLNQVSRRKRHPVVVVGVAVVFGMALASLIGMAINAHHISGLKSDLATQADILGREKQRTDLIMQSVAKLQNATRMMEKESSQFRNSYRNSQFDSINVNFATSYIMSKLTLGEEVLKSARREWRNGKVDPRLLSFLNVTLDCGEDCPVEYFRPISCYRPNAKTMSFHFHAPKVNQTLRYLKADPFKVNVINVNQSCIVEYTGPSTILHSVSSNCSFPLESGRHHKTDITIVPTHGCGNLTGKLNKMFHVKGCRPLNETHMVNSVQVKNLDGRNYIYCYGNNVTVFGTTRECPKMPFRIAETTPFMVNGFNFLAKQMNVYKQLYNTDSVNFVNVNISEDHFSDIESELRNSEQLLADAASIEVLPHPLPIYVSSSAAFVSIFTLIVLTFLFFVLKEKTKVNPEQFESIALKVIKSAPKSSRLSTASSINATLPVAKSAAEILGQITI